MFQYTGFTVLSCNKDRYTFVLIHLSLKFEIKYENNLHAPN